MRIITICGSTKFKGEIIRLAERFSLMGHVVLMPILISRDSNELSDLEIERLCRAHRRKIAMSDEVFIVNTDQYIGEHTKAEIAFAHDIGISVSYSESFTS